MVRKGYGAEYRCKKENEEKEYQRATEKLGYPYAVLTNCLGHPANQLGKLAVQGKGKEDGSEGNDQETVRPPWSLKGPELLRSKAKIEVD